MNWVKTGDLTNGQVSHTEERITRSAVDACRLLVHEPDTVLIAMYGGFKQIGRTGLLAIPAATNQAITAIRCDEATLVPAFLLSVLNARIGYWRSVAGSSRKDPNITRADIEFFPLLLPPVAEQSAIAATAKAWDSAVEKADALIEAKDRYKRGLMRDLLVADRNVGDPDTTRLSSRQLGELLTESRDRASSGLHARKLTVKLYGRGVVPKSDRRPGSPSTQYYRRHAGQLLFSKLDFLNGAFGIVPPELDGYETTLDLPAFDVSDEIHAPWLLRLFSWPGFYKRHVGLANGGRKARRVNPSDLLKVNLALPPIDEQKRIADLFRELDREIELLQRLRDAYAVQKRTLLDRLLTGELRLKPA